MVNAPTTPTNTTISASTVVSAPVLLASNETLTVAPSVTLTSTGTLAVYQPPSVTGGVSVINQGTIIAANAAYAAIDFEAGGSLSNQAGAVISGGDGFVSFCASTVLNAGTIAANGSYGFGASVNSGGQITRGDRSWRWSDGHGRLALPPSPTPTALRLCIGPTLPTWQRPGSQPRHVRVGGVRTGRTSRPGVNSA